jgi:uncharacterized protein YecT (DUF1311 family)
MKKWLILAAALVAASPAIGQDAMTAEDEILMQQCIETVNDMQRDGDQSVSMRECIGAASRVCMETNEGQTTIGMANCTMRENQWWDNYLNFLYSDLKGMLSDEQFAALRTAQRNWITYRDTKCDFEYEFWKEGTIRSIFYTSCILDTTAIRAIDLAGYMDWFN